MFPLGLLYNDLLVDDPLGLLYNDLLVDVPLDYCTKLLIDVPPWTTVQ